MTLKIEINEVLLLLSTLYLCSWTLTREGLLEMFRLASAGVRIGGPFFLWAHGFAGLRNLLTCIRDASLK